MKVWTKEDRIADTLYNIPWFAFWFHKRVFVSFLFIYLKNHRRIKAGVPTILPIILPLFWYHYHSFFILKAKIRGKHMQKGLLCLFDCVDGRLFVDLIRSIYSLIVHSFDCSTFFSQSIFLLSLYLMFNNTHNTQGNKTYINE